SYSFTICPFKGKPTPTENPTPPNTIVIGGGSSNVTDLGNSTATNLTKIATNETSVHQNTNMTGIHYSINNRNFTGFASSTKNITKYFITNSNADGSIFKSTSDIKIKNSSPLKQLESGIMTRDIQCKHNFVLLIKMENGHPGCVKPTSMTRLLSHGWITVED